MQGEAYRSQLQYCYDEKVEETLLSLVREHPEARESDSQDIIHLADDELIISSSSSDEESTTLIDRRCARKGVALRRRSKVCRVHVHVT